MSQRVSYLDRIPKWATLVGALWAAACSGDGSSGPEAAGSLIVTVSGLPSGVNATITVTGPAGFSRSLTATTSIADLAPGAYSIAASSVSASQGRFDASPPSQTVNVQAGGTPAQATVAYALVTGSLTVTISGLPSGVAGQVTVTGPAGFSRSLTATQTLTGLEPGSYTVAAAQVTTTDARYAATSPSQTAAVAAGSTPVQVTVTYLATGSLTVTINGLPSGASAQVTVTGPGGFSRAVTATTTLTGLAPGQYTVAAADVQGGNFTYRSTTPSSQNVAVTTSATPAAATVTYQAVDGALSITVTGLPTGVEARITVTGPGGFSTSVVATRTLPRLTAGQYQVVAAQVTSGPQVLTATPASQTLTVAVGAVASGTVFYAAPLVLRLVEVVNGLALPVHLTAPPGDATRMMVVEQAGRIRLVKNGVLQAQPFLDISARIPQGEDGEERGALGLAFHPRYAETGQFFVYYINMVNDIVIERFQVAANLDTANPAGTVVMTIDKPNDPYHNGGAITFGPDGYLYIGTGDGDCCRDPQENGQNRNTLLAKILRIDVNTLPYSVPSGNPFVGQAGRRPEIWAYGVRNPWRIDVDPVTGILYIGDVGEDNFEEVNVLRPENAGANFGWSIMEGPQCFGGSSCNMQGLTLPVVSYSSNFGCAITGGHVYRGSQLPELIGHYFYSDFCEGFLRSFLYVNGVATEQRTWNVPTPGLVSSFGKDSAGELYVVTYEGRVFRMARQ